MTIFNYKAVRDGKEYTGTLDAKDRFDVYRHIRKEGGKVISVSSEKENIFSFAYWNAKMSTVAFHDKIILANNLAAMVGAGLSITRALDVALRQTKNPKLHKVIETTKAKIESGSSLHEALASFPGVFSKIFIAMVRAGEESGNLPEALKTVAGQLERSYKLKKKIKGAMIYPVIIIIAIIGVGILMMVKIVPQLASTFKEVGAELPKSTQTIIAISDALKGHIVLTVLGFLGFVFMIVYGPKTHYGKIALDWLVLRIPLVSDLSKEINSARMARTCASLLSSGVDVVSTIDIAKDVVGNHYHAQVLEEASKEVQKGTGMSKIFMRNEHLYPPLVSEMIAVGEETGDLPNLLTQVAEFYEGEVAQKTKDMSTIIEPFLMLIIGAAVGFFAMAMIAPIYSLGDAM